MDLPRFKKKGRSHDSFRQTGGKWFVSIQTERETEIPVHQGTAVGIL